MFGVLFLGDERYHMMIVPVFALLAAPAVVSLAAFAGRLIPRRA